MSGCMVVGNVSDKVNISVGVISEEEVPGGSFVPGIRHIPQAATVFKKMGWSFVFLFEVDGGFHFVQQGIHIVDSRISKTEIMFAV